MLDDDDRSSPFARGWAVLATVAGLCLTLACRGAPAPTVPGPAPPAASATASAPARAALDDPPPSMWVPESWDGPDGPVWGRARVAEVTLTTGGALQWPNLRAVDLRTGAVRADAQPRWPEYPSQPQLAFEQGVVFAHPGGISLVDAATRVERWSVQLAPGEGMSGAPRFLWENPWHWAHVGSHLVALDRERWASHVRTPLRARGFSVGTGARAWEIDVADADHDARFVGACEGTFFVGVTRSMGPPGALLAFDAATGAPRWQREGAFALIAGVDVRVGCAAGRVVATNSTDVRMLDLRTGRDLWSRAFDGGSVLGATLADDAVYVGARGGDLAALAASDGHELWRTRGGASRTVNTVPIASRHRVFWVDGSTLRVFERATGALRWTYTEDDGRVHGASLLRDRGELLIFAGRGFDPDRDLTPHSVTLSGTAHHAPNTKVARGTSLEGLEISVGDTRTFTDARGRFTHLARGRGVARIGVDALEWERRHAAAVASAGPRERGSRPCIAVRHDGTVVDFERDPPTWTVTPVLDVQLCLVPGEWTQ